MPPIRPLAALVAAAGVLIVAPHLQSASAAPAADPSGVAPRGVAHQTPVIEGVVTDQFGHALDDVSVEATRGHSGSPAASALTYASDQDGGPQHGYFFLEVGRKGTYTLMLTKRGYRTVVLGPVRVRRIGATVDLGEIVVPKLYATTTAASLARRTVTTRQHGQVEVTVSTRATKRPTGDVVIRDGRRVVGRDEVRRGDRGRVDVALDRLAKGRHVLKAYFLGDGGGLKPSSSASVTLTVKKAGR